MMEIEKAIEIINREIEITGILESTRMKEFNCALKVGKDALEKQVGKNPKRFKFDEHISNLNCPSCNCVLFTEFSDGISAGEKVNFCPECGQKVNWGV